MEKQFEQVEQQSFHIGQEVIVNRKVGEVGHMGYAVVEYTRFVVVDGKIPKKETIRVVEGSALDMQLGSDNTWEKEVLRGDNQYVEVYVAAQKNPIVAHIGRLQAFQRPQGFREIRKFVREAAETIYTLNIRSSRTVLAECFAMHENEFTDDDLRILQSYFDEIAPMLLFADNYGIDPIRTIAEKKELYDSPYCTPGVMWHDAMHIAAEHDIFDKPFFTRTTYSQKQSRRLREGRNELCMPDYKELLAEVIAILFGRLTAKSYALIAVSKQSRDAMVDGLQYAQNQGAFSEYAPVEDAHVIESVQRTSVDYWEVFMRTCRHSLVKTICLQADSAGTDKHELDAMVEEARNIFESIFHSPPQKLRQYFERIVREHPDSDLCENLNSRVLLDVFYEMLPKRFFEDAA